MSNVLKRWIAKLANNFYPMYFSDVEILQIGDQIIAYDCTDPGNMAFGIYVGLCEGGIKVYEPAKGTITNLVTNYSNSITIRLL